MFNSPVDWCPVCRQWLALDEECPRGHAESRCPLSAARSGTSALMLKLDHAARPSRKHASSNKPM